MTCVYTLYIPFFLAFTLINISEKPTFKTNIKAHPITVIKPFTKKRKPISHWKEPQVNPDNKIFTYVAKDTLGSTG